MPNSASCTIRWYPSTILVGGSNSPMGTTSGAGTLRRRRNAACSHGLTNPNPLGRVHNPWGSLTIALAFLACLSTPPLWEYGMRMQPSLHYEGAMRVGYLVGKSIPLGLYLVSWLYCSFYVVQGVGGLPGETLERIFGPVRRAMKRRKGLSLGTKSWGDESSGEVIENCSRTDDLEAGMQLLLYSSAIPSSTGIECLERGNSSHGKCEVCDVLKGGACNKTKPASCCSVPANVKVLVPGAGLGRLAFEIARLGYNCQGNEFSLFMLFASNFVLNKYSLNTTPSHVLSAFTVASTLLEAVMSSPLPEEVACFTLPLSLEQQRTIQILRRCGEVSNPLESHSLHKYPSLGLRSDFCCTILAVKAIGASTGQSPSPALVPAAVRWSTTMPFSSGGPTSTRGISTSSATSSNLGEPPPSRSPQLLWPPLTATSVVNDYQRTSKCHPYQFLHFFLSFSITSVDQCAGTVTSCSLTIMMCPQCSACNARRCEQTNLHTVYPWVHQYVNNLKLGHQTKGITFPDVNPSDLPKEAQFSMIAGDFLEQREIERRVRGCKVAMLVAIDNHFASRQACRGGSKPDSLIAPRHSVDKTCSEDRTLDSVLHSMATTLQVYNEPCSWDCVSTCFFIDCANNVVAFVETIFKILKPGGVWINLGPLYYHFADMPNENSIEPTYEELREVIKGIGFEIKPEQGFAYLPLQSEQGFAYPPLQYEQGFAYLPLQSELGCVYLPLQPEQGFVYLPLQPEQGFAYLPLQPEQGFFYLSLQPEQGFFYLSLQPEQGFGYLPLQPEQGFVARQREDPLNKNNHDIAPVPLFEVGTRVDHLAPFGREARRQWGDNLLGLAWPSHSVEYSEYYKPDPPIAELLQPLPPTPNPGPVTPMCETHTAAGCCEVSVVMPGVLCVQKEDTNMRTTYTQNPMSMLKYEYTSVFCVCLKPAKTSHSTAVIPAVDGCR
ncbi:hypothetical protein PR048_025854 [Dryococelus australis]|uniref:carnosine N-methyltransferase n=1 Tax=Dryococelus australis TaxID=614101 RepID=A0ABQ9GJQ8_9NEOP|nr:hypothetical protein PR048_025854 [Dryococelus australis]